MSSLEITTLITVVANTIAENVSDEDALALLAVIFSQLGDTIATIAEVKALCNRLNDPKKEDTQTKQHTPKEPN
jgi:hypothetical protein